MTAESGSGCCCCKAAIVVALVAIGYFIYKRFCGCGKQARKSPLKTDFKEGMVYLYQFPRVKGLANLSPFCLKLETWLRMANIKYEIPEYTINTWSCEGTVPFLEYNGKEYPDSSFAIRDMTAIFGKESMEKHLTPEQKAIGRSFEELAENSLVITIAIDRWGENYDAFIASWASIVFKMFTPIVVPLSKIFIAPAVVKKLKQSFVGRHSRSEMFNIAREDLRAISVYLGSKNFFFGDQPTRIDAALFGTLAQIVYSPYSMPHQEFIGEDMANLKRFCDRMRERFWPDWNELTHGQN